MSQMSEEQRKQLEEMASQLAHANGVSRFDAHHFNAFMAGAQAAFDLRDGEITELKKSLNTAVCLFDSKLGEEERFIREANKLLSPQDPK